MKHRAPLAVLSHINIIAHSMVEANSRQCLIPVIGQTYGEVSPFRHRVNHTRDTSILLALGMVVLADLPDKFLAEEKPLQTLGCSRWPRLEATHRVLSVPALTVWVHHPPLR